MNKRLVDLWQLHYYAPETTSTRALVADELCMTEDVNPSLTKPPLKFNGGLAKLGLTSLVKYTTGAYFAPRHLQPSRWRRPVAVFGSPRCDRPILPLESSDLSTYRPSLTKEYLEICPNVPEFQFWCIPVFFAGVWGVPFELKEVLSLFYFFRPLPNSLSS